ncbi:hypothetical protein FACS1894167_11620 [Synergistales bacterium]|nr:hypothetical protein FACS1894167_11620 [Synergistales bacterium]
MIKTTQKYELSFEWRRVAAGYKWEGCEPCDLWGEPFSNWKEDRRREFEEMFQTIPDGPYLTEVSPRLMPIIWKPLTNPLLFAQFADIRPDVESFLRWANEHGRLIDVEGKLDNYVFIFLQYTPLDEIDADFQRNRGLCVIERNGRHYHRVKADPLGFWIQEYRQLSFDVMLWELVSDNDPRLNGILEWNEKAKRIYVNKIWKEALDEIDFERFEKDTTYNPICGAVRDRIYDFDSQILTKSGKFDYAKAASIYVQQEITCKLEEYPLKISFKTDEDGSLCKVIQPTSLLSAMWYQLYLAQTGDIKLRRCSLCGKWENMNGHRSTWSKHANCANYGRVKRARHKKKEEESIIRKTCL